jgi:iron(III) transport system substrate-binding protein
VAHPGYSGAMGGWVLSMNKLYGWEFFEKLKLNKPHIGRSLVDPPTAVASGERKIGIAAGSSAGGLQARGNPIQGVYPEGKTIISFSPTGLIATSTHPNAGKLFLEFMLSKQAGEIVASEYTIPVRSDVEPAPGIPKFGTLKGLTKDPNELHDQVPGLIEKWRDTFGV